LGGKEFKPSEAGLPDNSEIARIYFRGFDEGKFRSRVMVLFRVLLMKNGDRESLLGLSSKAENAGSLRNFRDEFQRVNGGG